MSELHKRIDWIILINLNVKDKKNAELDKLKIKIITFG
jgi:hypothetical protein